MKFGPVPIADALGSVAAHSVRAGDAVVKKGAVIDAGDIARLAAAGVETVVAVQLEPGDVDENTAAARLADAMAGHGLRVEAPFTGRANLFAARAGVFVVDAAAIDRANTVDEAITVATLPAFKPVVAGEMVATDTSSPDGLPGERVAAARAAIAAPPLSVAPYALSQVGVISTLLPGLKRSVVEKTLGVMAERLAPAGARIVADDRVPHDIAPLVATLRTAAAGPAELLVVFGASAITDRRDVIPQALVEAGGTVEHLGMPVDPGNLLMIGSLAGKPVLGAPGCARSPKENGFDWVLQRLLAGLEVTRAEIQRLGVGGLLMEIVSRPQPRAPGQKGPAGLAGIVLAAGRSSRMGSDNKLLQTVRGEPLVRHAVRAQAEAGLSPVLVVTGHQAAEVEAALAGLDVRFVHNPDFAAGMAGSLRAGIAAAPDAALGAIVSLGDMPNVTSALLARLADAFRDRPEALAVVPTLLGRRGNPVLLARAAFGAVSRLDGDQGARGLLEAAGEAVVEVPLDDPAIALDVDTPEALAALRGRE